MTTVTITGLNLYPIKSCRGTALERSTLGPAGLEGDRRWMVITEAGKFLSQRRLPRLALITPTLDPDRLTLSAPEMPDLRLGLDPAGPAVEVTALNDQCTALDAGAEPAGWLSRFLGQPVRLVRFDPNGRRTTNPEWGGATAPIEFPDGFPLMILSDASLEDLNRRLEAPLPINRFRPNIVITGLEPYGEDRARELMDGPIRLRLVWPCPRCKLTTTDQATGQVSGPEPLVTLKSYRWNPEIPGVLFGYYAVIADGVGAELRLGQRLTVE